MSENGKKPIPILVADDEPQILDVLKRFLTKAGYEPILASNGNEALGKAKIQKPRIALLDVNMPGMDGLTVCQKLREDPATRLLPVLFLTARAGVEDKLAGFKNGADDYVCKPFDFGELRARIETLLKRTERMIAANPLTHLPGSPGIQDEIECRIRVGEKFAVAYVDIDNFKVYNDLYGFEQGDQVIQWTAKMLQICVARTVTSWKTQAPFVGHIGGDDFIVVVDLEQGQNCFQKIAEEFDQTRKKWYNFWHSHQGHVKAKDRLGNERQFPLMTLSIGVSTNDVRNINHYGQIAQVMSEMKTYAKKRINKDASYVAYDRRKN